MSLKHLKTCLCMMLGSALTLWGGEAFAQQKLSGKVIDPAGNPVIGATVVIDGTTKGASTDLDGAFSFDEKAGTPITISYIGYQTVKTTLQPGMTVQLQEDSALLEDVVVVGYGVQKKETLTGAISVVKEEMLKDKGSLSSPLQAMQGQIPGVIITRSSSAPGDESWSMSLRGAISANSSEPLVIIDGVAYESINEMRLLNPSDIESMSFLKDGATAIYGSRAAGGVVLITTKKGKEGRARVEYSGSFSVKTVGLMPTMMTLDEWADSLIQTLENDNNTGDMWYQFAHLAKEYKGHYIDLNKTADPMNGGFKDVVDFVFDDSSDWLGSLFGNAYSTTHDISVSGGSEKISYRVSFGYLYDGSPLQYGNNNNQRYNLRTNNTFQITDWLKLESAIGYNRQEQVAPTNIGSMLTVTLPWPGLPLFTQDGKPYGWGSGDWNSPAAQAEYGGDNKLSVSAVNISETFKIRATKWLDANINLGYNTSAANRHTVNNSVDYYNYAGDMKIYTKPTADENYYKQTSSKTDFYSFSGYLNAHHDFGDHSLSATLGGQYEFKDYTYFGVQAKNIQTGLEIVNGSGEITISNKEHYQFAVASLFGRLNYDYRQKYLVELNMRYDGSSKFQPANRWDFFWGGSLGWRISQEGSLRDLDWLSELKLRLSYGEVGNQNGISNYDGVQLYKTDASTGALVGSGLLSTIATSGTLASTARSWERIKNYNIGLDFGFLNNRLTGTVEAFFKKNDNMLVSIEFPSALGDTPPKANTGKFKAWGYEGMAQWRDKIGENFNYFVGGTFTFARNELVDFGGAATIKNGYVSDREGYPLNALFGLRYAGKIQTQEQLDAYLAKYYPNNAVGMPASLRLGDNMFCDVNDDGRLDEKDYVYLGSDTPEIQYSINAGFEWKGLDFQIVFQGAANRTMWNGINNWTVPMRAKHVNTTNQSLGKVWSPENPGGHYPTYTLDSNINNYNYQASSWSASDGAYIRLKTLSLGYNLPARWFAKTKSISGCRIYFTGSDLWEHSNILDGWDPEAKASGNVKSGTSATYRYPFLRSYTFGVNLTF